MSKVLMIPTILRVKSSSGMKRLIVFMLCLMVLAAAPLASAKENISDEALDNEEAEEMKMLIGDIPVQVEWEKNASVDALRELAKDGLTIQMSMYGGFEQVGFIGSSLPRQDVQTSTSSGDIVLYSGDQLVVFYGSNAWAYTRLGKITDQSVQTMRELLGNGDVTLSIFWE